MSRRAPSRIASILVLLLVVSACSDRAPEAAPEPQAGDEAATVTLGDAEPELAPFAEVPQPIALAAHPDGEVLYVAERAGRVHRVDSGSGEPDPEPVLDISGDVSTGGERGLLGIAVDPAGEHLYVDYTNRQGDTRVDEYALDDTSVDASSRRQLLAVEQPFANHNGGNVVFGPDGMLYVGLGDGGSGGDPQGNGQDPTTRLGSILRIDPDGADPYAVPEDNPFVDGGGAPEVWAYGLRNPWRFSFDRETGDLWIGDVGQNRLEEVDWLPSTDGLAGRGANLGWAELEGTERYDGGEPPEGHVPPVFEYVNDDQNCAVTGGYVYRGDALPSLAGAYVFGDFCAGVLRYLRLEDGRTTEVGDLGLSVAPSSLVSFGEDVEGNLFVLSIAENLVYRLEARP